MGGLLHSTLLQQNKYISLTDTTYLSTSQLISYFLAFTWKATALSAGTDREALPLLSTVTAEQLLALSAFTSPMMLQ
jgi:hypothetical protein